MNIPIIEFEPLNLEAQTKSFISSIKKSSESWDIIMMASPMSDIEWANC